MTKLLSCTKTSRLALIILLLPQSGWKIGTRAQIVHRGHLGVQHAADAPRLRRVLELKRHKFTGTVYCAGKKTPGGAGTR